ncbi:MAG TPA: hypothetical protein VFA57_03725 [Pseudolabrys sp.]|nr:hypothetical protein [Pseudolabrys sp.]
MMWTRRSLLALIGFAAAAPASPQTEPRAAALAEYREKLAIYERIHGAFERESDAYWDAVAAKRRIRIAKRRNHEDITLDDYVLTQPPIYTGPPAPVSPLPPPPPPPVPPPPEIPTVSDFLIAAQEQWGFVPKLPATDAEFKRAYAKAARAAGLTREQIVGVYAFETGGRGQYNTQAGLGTPRPNARAISPAIGYNQLLSTNTVSLFGESGPRFLALLGAKERTLAGTERVAFARRFAIIKRMIAYCRSLPHRWSEYDEIAKHTQKGWGIHAAVLDIDVGPLLQVQKLLDSVIFARAKGYMKPLTAAELELMNLTGDGNGIDMVTMPQAMREQVPTANFFQPKGYARNPVAKRTKVVAGLIAEMQRHMDENASTPGALEMAAAY